MKTYGQIKYEAEQAYYAEHGEGVLKEHICEWDKCPTVLAKGASEAGAQAAIEEFKRRHNIVIPPEED